MGKSTEHFLIQQQICQLLPSQQIHLEWSFPAIKRRADVFWAKENIVFEIQCSPLTFEDIQQRSADYKRLALQVVWLFDKRLFGAPRPSELMRNLGKYPHYFFDERGFFDRLVLFGCRKAFFLEHDLKISLEKPQPMYSKKTRSLTLASRTQRSLYFAGDFFDLYQNNPERLHQLLHKEKQLLSKSRLLPLAQGLCHYLLSIF